MPDEGPSPRRGARRGAVAGLRARARRLLGRDLLADLDRRLSTLETDTGAHLAALEAQAEETRLRVDTTQEGLLLAEASRLLPKRPVVLLVEAQSDYGNLSALARALHADLGPDHVAVLARDEASADRWHGDGVRAHTWTTAPGVGASEVWHLAITAAVSVYEHHDWWRIPDQFVRRGLLAGSAKVQLWHGGSSGFGKEVALLTTPTAPGMAEFADVTTTSVGFGAFVCEPAAAAKRAEEFRFDRHVADVNFRMVAPLRRDGAGPRPAGPPRVLVAPTYPESDRGAQALAVRVRAYAHVAATTDAEVVVRFHPWTPPDVRAAAAGLTVMDNQVDVYDALETFDVLVTDFSSLASDVLLLGRRVVLDHSDAPAYVAERSLRRYEDVLACCDIATTAQEALTLATDPGTDTRADLRAAHAGARLDSLGAPPGENTLRTLRDLLTALP